MAFQGTVGQLLVDEALPEAMRGRTRTLDKKGIGALLQEVAEKHPARYAAVAQRLSDLGRRAATASGGYGFGPEHMLKGPAGRRHQADVEAAFHRLLDADDDADDRASGGQRRLDRIVTAAGAAMQPQMDDVYREAVAAKNPLALQVLSGARGNKMNLSSLLGSDMLYADHRDRVIPLPVTRSYSQGLTPSQYWAGTYGARKGVLAVKFATRDAGYLSKQLNQIAHRLVVTAEDAPEDTPDRGLPVDTDDADNEGALLARPAGPYPRNTVLTPKILHHLKTLNQNRILVRSPLVGGSPEGGIYARDAGIREYGTLPGRGEQVGLTAAQALSEPLSQSQLSAKHKGGVAGQDKGVTGFKAIDQMIQTPKTFKGGAAHADVDGRIQRIVPAPAGGHFVTIADQPHYVNQGYDLKVGVGDEVEAGDVISEGLPNPSAVVRHKGIGEGRRYFVAAMHRAMADAGIRVHRRNLELLARGLINHVRISDENASHVPGDVESYAAVERDYQPRGDAAELRPDAAAGQYLERPVLHYTIGTKLRPSVIRELNQFQIGAVQAHRDPPPFAPDMVRGMASVTHDPDWMTRLYGSGQKASLLKAVHHGASSDEQGTSFVPGLARAVDFGRTGLVRQPEPGTRPEEIAMPKPPALDLDALAPKQRWGPFKTAVDHTDQIRRADAVLAQVARELGLTKAAGPEPIVDRQPAPPAGRTPGLGPPLAAGRAALGRVGGGNPVISFGGHRPTPTPPRGGGATTADVTAALGTGTAALGRSVAAANPFAQLAHALNPAAYATLTQGGGGPTASTNPIRFGGTPAPPQAPAPAPVPAPPQAAPPSPPAAAAAAPAPPPRSLAATAQSLPNRAAATAGDAVIGSAVTGGATRVGRGLGLLAPAAPQAARSLGARALGGLAGTTAFQAGDDLVRGNGMELASFYGNGLSGQGWAGDPAAAATKRDFAANLAQQNVVERGLTGLTQPVTTATAAVHALPQQISDDAAHSEQLYRQQRLEGQLGTLTAGSLGRLAAKRQQGIALTPGEQVDYANWQRRQAARADAATPGMDSGALGSF